MVRSFRKPLIVITPKTPMLRNPAVVSSLDELATGTTFKSVIGDDKVIDENVTKIILTCGKQYYALDKYRNDRNLRDAAIVRVESLCPFPALEINEQLQKYKNAQTYVWSQEEPRNMGAWSFIKPRFENLCGRKLRYAGREPLATPAVGIGKLYQSQSEDVVVQPFAMK